MVRIRSSLKLKHKKKSKGFIGSGQYKQILQKYNKSLKNKYKSRKLKKRNFRRYWIKTINNCLKNLSLNLKYSLFISSLKQNYIVLNRKTLFLILIFDEIVWKPV